MGIFSHPIGVFSRPMGAFSCPSLANGCFPMKWIFVDVFGFSSFREHGLTRHHLGILRTADLAVTEVHSAVCCTNAHSMRRESERVRDKWSLQSATWVSRSQASWRRWVTTLRSDLNFGTSVVAARSQGWTSWDLKPQKKDRRQESRIRRIRSKNESLCQMSRHGESSSFAHSDRGGS